MTSRKGRLAYAIAGAIRDAPRPEAKPPLFDSRDTVKPSVFHVTYKDVNGLTQTGRVSVTDDRHITAGMLRQKAIKAAMWKFNCKANTVSAVRVYPKENQ